MNKWQTFLNARKLPYKHLPAEVVEKAVEVITRIEAGEADRELKGSVMQRDRRELSFPICYRYRLVAMKEQGRILFTHLLSHEAYNRLGA